ncbi:MAG: DUF2029 domain-containing protein [Candidatus Kerfeldbacteria bacterium]|nr:DUF2029 domain-containing protein [Candidatus Kerfeldbacteria bacterium]
MIGLDALLLFVLVLKTVSLFTLRTSAYLFALPDNYLVFSIVPLLVLAGYVAVSALRPAQRSWNVRFGAVVLLGVFLVGSLFGLQLFARRNSLPYLFIHDGAVQAEDAIAALRQGQNPYTIDYRERTFGAFPDGFSEATRPNPAWTHHIYLPLQLLLGLPIAIVSEVLWDWFDIRLLYALSFALLIICTALLSKNLERRLLVLILGLFNPLFLPFFAAGFNDVFFLGWIALGALLLQRRRFTLAGLALGFAFASKQSAWFLLPFYAAYVYATAGGPRRWWVAARRLLPAVLVTAVVIAPFFAWSPADFIDDTIRYGTGSAELSYPISGFGLSQLMLASGVIRSSWDYYPFWIFQVIVGLPLLAVLIRRQRRDPSVSQMLTSFGLLAFALWFVSRFFNDSYVGVLSVVFLLAYAAQEPARENNV